MAHPISNVAQESAGEKTRKMVGRQGFEPWTNGLKGLRLTFIPAFVYRHSIDIKKRLP